MRLNYPGGVRIVRVPCTGKVDVIHMLRAFERGADGVFLVGCLEGACAFEQGNLRAKRRVRQAKKILELTGIGGERVEMFNLSSSEAPLFKQYVEQMHQRVMELGPNPARLKLAKTA